MGMEPAQFGRKTPHPDPLPASGARTSAARWRNHQHAAYHSDQEGCASFWYAALLRRIGFSVDLSTPVLAAMATVFQFDSAPFPSADKMADSENHNEQTTRFPKMART